MGFMGHRARVVPSREEAASGRGRQAPYRPEALPLPHRSTVDILEPPELNQLQAEGGVAVWAHVGGFVAGVVLVKLFENHALTAQRSRWRHRLHPDHP